MTYDIVGKATEFSRDFETDGDREQQLKKTIDFLHEELDETKQALAENDKPEIVDGFGDVAFVALNGIYKEFRGQGDDHEAASTKVTEVMKRICEANLGKKQSDGTVLRVDGKVQKPEGWKPPQYDDIIKAA